MTSLSKSSRSNSDVPNTLETYCILTFGCQMNKHDSERVAGLLQAQNMMSVELPEQADVIVFMTCCIREKADERLYGQVASLKALKTGGKPNVLIAVGGCIGQRDGASLVEQIPHVDVVFGTHNIDRLFELLSLAEASHTAHVEVLEDTQSFASELPAVRENKYHAWLPITVGCDNFCTYCVVPYVRGRERSRIMNDVIEEAEQLVADGVQEITLLGQNVNSYGRDLYGEPAFAQLLEKVAKTGIARLAFSTSHPKDLTDETIAVMASSPVVLNALHLPFQSGSNKILKAMNRIYSREDYIALVERVYAAMPTISLSTDIIVGFPGETENDFLDTLSMIQECDIDYAYTFIYSPREGTPAALMDGQIDYEVSLERFNRLLAAVKANAYKKNLKSLDTLQNVLVEGTSKRNDTMLTGRTHQNKTIHFPLPEGTGAVDWIGKTVSALVTETQTWYLTGILKK